MRFNLRPSWHAAIAAALLGLLAAARAGAEILSTLFPEGLPGRGHGAGITVGSRLREEQAPVGLRDGPWQFFPGLDLISGFDTNPAGQPSRQGSWRATIAPSLGVAGDWSTLQLAFQAGVSHTAFSGLPAQNRTDGNVALGGSADLGRDRLNLAASYVSTHQDRTELDALPTDRPVPVQVGALRASYDLRDGRWIWSPAIRASHWLYGGTTIQGAPVSQSYRDRSVLQGGLTLRYELAPLRSLVLVARAVGQHYTRPVPGTPSPDSTGFQLLAGIDWDEDGVWRYRLLLGGETRRFAYAGYAPQGGLIAEAEVAWMPTGMTTLRASLVRGFADAAQEGVSGYLFTAARLRIDHELTRQVILSGRGGVSQAMFFQGGGRQWAWSLGAEATWLMNRSLRLSASWDASAIRGGNLTVGPVNGDYTRSVALLSMRMGL